ncbi:MAG TPA: AcvB/VirJ family lysyl-phosphatidylglycerol hydrolase [Flavisolibacter sp.]|nr:AcvB/VirJ family lysyl-phosphatidylglycerol hydrolase [Flavisolibacter sp.]
MFLILAAHAQNNLPLQYTDNTDTSKPLIVYISGDGGMNSFTSSLIKSLNKKGYAVLALDAKDYFWHKKDPQDFASAMSLSINNYLNSKKRNGFILLGYSFGADVSPFLVTRLPSSLRSKCKEVMLLSPSTNTNFEIKVLDMLGWGSSKGKNVVNELNKVNAPVVLFFGSDEKDFPLNEITIKKQVVIMEGGHHYDNNVDDLASKIVGKIR